MVTIDLEWNNAYVDSVKRMVNIVISIGAVKTDEQGNIIETFHELVKPPVKMKLKGYVKKLTNISDFDLKSGKSFKEALTALGKFIDDDICLFWGQSDMAVLIENCSVFLNKKYVPFINRFIDAMEYCNSKSDFGKGQQLSLTDFCTKIGIDTDEFIAHEPTDDAIMAFRCFEKLGGLEISDEFITVCDAEYFARKAFRNRKITKLTDSALHEKDLQCNCPNCGKKMDRKGSFVNNGNLFQTRFSCDNCKREYFATMSFTLKYDGVKRHCSLRRWKNKDK